MTEVEITIYAGSDMTQVKVTGTASAALRTCIIRMAERYASDPAMQKLAEAVAHVEVQR